MQTKSLKSLLLIICIIVLFGCSESKAQVSYNTISVDDAYYMINSNTNIIILDVRTKSEFDEGHLENEINIPYDEVESRFKSEVTSDFESTIIVYCKSGVRAETASKTLINLGYINVYTFGGINDWNYEIVK